VFEILFVIQATPIAISTKCTRSQFTCRNFDQRSVNAISCIESPKLFSISCAARYRARMIEHSIFHSESRLSGYFYFVQNLKEILM